MDERDYAMIAKTIFHFNHIEGLYGRIGDFLSGITNPNCENQEDLTKNISAIALQLPMLKAECDQLLGKIVNYLGLNQPDNSVIINSEVNTNE